VLERGQASGQILGGDGGGGRREAFEDVGGGDEALGEQLVDDPFGVAAVAVDEQEAGGLSVVEDRPADGAFGERELRGGQRRVAAELIGDGVELRAAASATVATGSASIWWSAGFQVRAVTVLIGWRRRAGRLERSARTLLAAWRDLDRYRARCTGAARGAASRGGARGGCRAPGRTPQRTVAGGRNVDTTTREATPATSVPIPQRYT